MPMNVLLVTEPTTRPPMIETMLQLFGATVSRVPCDDRLPERLFALRPEVVVLDLEMPPEEAAVPIRRLRACPFNGAIPLVAVTGASFDVHRLFAAGCDQVVVKPFNRQTLLAALAAALQRNANDQSLGSEPPGPNPNTPRQGERR